MATTQWQDILSDAITRAGVPVAAKAPSVCNPISIAATAVEGSLLPSDHRLGATFFNDSDRNLYLNLGSEVSSPSKFTVIVAPQGYYEAPYNYGGEVRGFWAAGATGACRITTVNNPLPVTV